MTTKTYDLPKEMSREQLYHFLKLLLEFHLTNENPRSSFEKEIRQDFVLARNSIDLYLKEI